MQELEPRTTGLAMPEIVSLSAPTPASSDLGSIADFLKFYDRRGYGFDVGIGAKTAILVIDFSIAFTEGTANFPGGGYDREVANTRRILDAARFGTPILYTTIAYEQHMEDAGHWFTKIPWIKGLQTGTREVEIDERLDPRPGETVLVKKYPSAFFGTELDSELKRLGVDTLVITGCTTSSCVRATTVDSMQYGYRTIVVGDAVSDIVPQLHAIHLADLRSRYADVMSTDEVVAYYDGLRGASPVAPG